MKIPIRDLLKLAIDPESDDCILEALELDEEHYVKRKRKPKLAQGETDR